MVDSIYIIIVPFRSLLLGLNNRTEEQYLARAFSVWSRDGKLRSHVTSREQSRDLAHATPPTHPPTKRKLALPHTARTLLRTPTGRVEERKKIEKNGVSVG